MSTFVLPSGVLRDALQAASKAASRDKGFPVLCAVQLSASPDGVSLCVSATDRFVLLTALAPCEGVALSDTRSAVLSMPDLAAAVKLLPRKGVVSVSLARDTIGFAVLGGVSSSFLTVDGDYPVVSRLFPPADVLGTGLGLQSLTPHTLALLASVKVDGGWIIGQQGNEPRKPVAASGTIGVVGIAALIMPNRADGAAVDAARESYAAVTGARVSVQARP